MRSFFRLLAFLRPHLRASLLSLVLSCLAVIGTVAIPLLLGEVVDAVKQGDRDVLLPLAGAIVAAGVARLALAVPRRLISGRVSLGVEYDLRNRLYRHLQSLELGFFDRQQTGQLMSRVTVDLQSVRFFLGYGLIFILQNLLTILLAAIVMFVLQPSLAAITLAPVPLVVLAAARYGRHSRPALQEVQQRIAELTADVEE
ncbi:MAG: ABC transporter transmembrane domain-containing protein, partial [Solirubrobacterales bacterium]